MKGITLSGKCLRVGELQVRQVALTPHDPPVPGYPNLFEFGEDLPGLFAARESRVQF
jgi:hypothetical protein